MAKVFSVNLNCFRQTLYLYFIYFLLKPALLLDLKTEGGRGFELYSHLFSNVMCISSFHRSNPREIMLRRSDKLWKF